METEETIKPETNKRNVAPLVGGLVVVFIVIGIVLISGSSKKPGNQTLNTVPQATVEGANSQQSADSAVPAGNVKEFTVGGTNFAFSPNKITVKKGDMVKITFRDDDGTHNLVVTGYNVSTNVIGEGSQDTIQFVADKSGTFEYFCSVGGHREAGMVGTLVVE